MKCTECGAKCIKVEVDSTATRVSFECPSCCNVFEKHVRMKVTIGVASDIPPPADGVPRFERVASAFRK